MRRRLLGLILSLAAALPAAAAAEPPLFANNDLLEVTLAVDFSELCRPRESDDCEFTPSILHYREPGGDKRDLPVEIKIRGGWRSLSRNCSIPLLWVSFEKSAVAGTLFEGQKLLPLTTHCGRGLSPDPAIAGIPRSDYEQYLLREYLGYRLYNVLTDHSLRVRLLRIAYLKPGARRGVPHYAFFAEHFDAVAERTGTRHLERGQFDAEKLDAQSAAVLALFQFLVGNTDWSIARERNTMLLESDEGRQLPVPYDLDMTGLVNAKYAGPAPGLPINDVRQRYFLGYCQPGIDWDTLFDRYASRRDAIVSMAEGVPGMSRNSVRYSQTYLEDFFELLASDEEREDRIVGHCQPWPPSETDHMSPRPQYRSR